MAGGMMMVIAVTRQCEGRRQRAGHAGTTKGTRPWGSERHPQSFAFATIVFLIVRPPSHPPVRDPLYVLAEGIPTYTAYRHNACPPYKTDVASESGTRTTAPQQCKTPQ